MTIHFRSHGHLTLPLIMAFVFIANMAYFISLATCHAMLLQPPNRDPSNFRTYGDDNNSIGCPVDDTGTIRPTKVMAGKPMTVQYGRNNHVGGFIRFSIIPKGQPETRENFDNNVFWYNCRENVCGPNLTEFAPITLNGDNSEAGTIFNGNVRINAILCTYEITVPAWLQTGAYVLQWTQYGAGHNNGDPKAPIAIYKSCSDIFVSNPDPQPDPGCATFVGGDRSSRGCAQNPSLVECSNINSFNLASANPNNVCLYFDSNELTRPFDNHCSENNVSKCYFFGRPQGGYKPLCSTTPTNIVTGAQSRMDSRNETTLSHRVRSSSVSSNIVNNQVSSGENHRENSKCRGA